MDPIQTPVQQPVQNTIPTIPVQPRPNLILIILSTLTVILLSSVIFLLFQNQKLQKQVLSPPVSPTVQAPSPAFQTVSPTPKTVSSISVPPDETAEWKTYTNNDLGAEFSFKYPVSLTLDVEKRNLPQALYMFLRTKNDGVVELNLSLEKRPESRLSTLPIESSKNINNIKWDFHKPPICENNDTYCPSAGGYTAKFNDILISYHPFQTVLKVSDQILSTFRFVEDKTVNKVCGGIIGTNCPAGYVCSLDGSYPDSSGTCVLQNDDK